ncbi:MAG TPA: putative sugar nucleotidyl transferase [Gemmatimonadaceae bacterium]|nr:putative sugar nucleotidyl transferase [Gemmatimonadaceae bacterium]
MTSLFLYDDQTAREFEPFTLTRPVSELMAGAVITRERWEKVSGLKAEGFIGAEHLRHFDEAGAPRCIGGDTVIPPGSLIANSRFVPSLASSLRTAPGELNESGAFNCGDEICAVRTKEAIRVSEITANGRPLSAVSRDGGSCVMKGRWLTAVWELIGTLTDQLTEDIPALAAGIQIIPVDTTVLGTFGVFREAGSTIEPYVVLDATAGPILIRSGATISSFSRIVGPCYIGPHATIVGDAIRACSIGDTCKVRGEISNSIMLGFSNKGHTGFVGHSYLGRWVNLGAGTTTSNLKNTYGSVQLSMPSGMRETGAQFLGTLFGDHVKTGIGTMLTTGTILGMGANVYGGSVSSKYVPPFTWGADDTYEIRKFIDVAQRMMSRRHVELSADGARLLEDAYAVSRGNRQ